MGAGDSFMVLPWVESCRQGRARTKPKKDFQPQGRLAPLQVRAQVSHTARSRPRLGTAVFQRGGTDKMSLLLALAVPWTELGLLLICDDFKSILAESLSEHSSHHIRPRERGTTAGGMWGSL